MIPAPRRRRLVHVVPNLMVNSITTHIWDMLMYLKDYHHTVLFEGNILDADTNLLWALANTGADVLHVTSAGDSHRVGPLPHGVVTTDMLQQGEYDAAILHSLMGHAGLGKAIPSIYYSYGVYDPAPQPDITVCCSQYAVTHARVGSYASPLPGDTLIIHPGVPARRLRRRAFRPEQFAVGLFNSGCFGQYPIGLARHLLSKLDRDVVLYLSAPVKHVQELQYLAKKANRNVNLVPIQAFQYRQALMHLDVLIQGFSPNYNSPYSKTVIEAMCMGIPVIYQRSGFLAEQLIDEQHCLFFDERHEAVERLHLLRQDTNASQAIGLNAQAWAFTQDQSVYMNQIRSLLRRLGA